MIPALVAAVAAVVGAVISANSARDTNNRNNQLANRQTAFQESMANSAHQREVADLKLAGLNPILSANKGAATPSGASIANQNPIPDNVLNTALSSARDTATTKASLEKTSTELELNRGALDLQQKQGMATVASAKASEAQAEKAKTESAALEAQMPAIKSGSILETKQNKLNEKMVEADAVINRVGTAFNGLNSAKKLFTKPRTDTFFNNNTGEVTREIRRP